MEIFNDGLPKEVFQLITENEYEKPNEVAFCSVTDLLRTPKEFWLKRKYAEGLKVGASNFIESIYGTIWHLGFETMYNKKKFNTYEQETRMYFKILVDDIPYIIAGKPDLYNKEEKSLKDFKETSVWTIINGSRIDHWEKQLNIYAYCMNYGFWTDENIEIRNEELLETRQVDSLSILYKCRDWRKGENIRNEDYPSKVGEINIRMYLKSETEELIANLIREKVKYQYYNVDDIPECVMEERWQNPEQYAVMKKGGKRAVRVCATKGQAFGVMKQSNHPHSELYIQVRESEPTKCKDYCLYAEYCNWYKKWLAEKNNT